MFDKLLSDRTNLSKEESPSRGSNRLYRVWKNNTGSSEQASAKLWVWWQRPQADSLQLKRTEATQLEPAREAKLRKQRKLVVLRVVLRVILLTIASSSDGDGDECT